MVRRSMPLNRGAIHIDTNGVSIKEKEEMIYSDIQAAPYTIWKHVKTNSLYVVLGIAWDSTNKENDPVHEDRYVVYVSQTTGLMRVREISEFLDGRFEPMGFDASNVYPNSLGGNGSNQCHIKMLLPDGRSTQCTLKHGHQGMHVRGIN